jgi:lipopolysaccharide transport system ATP-binding protein
MNAIEADNLSKHYRVYIKPIDRLKESILRKPCHHLVTSLVDVSFQVGFGETLGIIGENGAGKSTLLKILAGTTQPSSGRLLRKGRIAALLELGAGFNPEFSGRTNIHLNAALLGLTEKEIRNREDSIISFSELGDVIDRPVKTYSSGMHLRLAFSIATSVDPDVLIVDEALSVGDARFGQKCVDRMMGFRKGGKTIIVCSHSMYLINELCEKTIWLNSGRLQGYGMSAKIISEYLAFLESKNESSSDKSQATVGAKHPEVIIDDVAVLDINGHPITRVNFLETIRICLKARSVNGKYIGHIGIGIEKVGGEMVFVATTKNSGQPPVCFGEKVMIHLILNDIKIIKGSYRIHAVISDEHAISVINEFKSASFSVESRHPELGLFWIDHQWEIL